MKRSKGRVYKRAGSANWHMAFNLNGRELRKSAETADELVAWDKLAIWMGETAKGAAPETTGRQLTVAQLLEHYRLDRANAGRCGTSTTTKLKRLTRELGHLHVVEITSRWLRGYIERRTKTDQDRITVGSVRAELQLVRAAVRLGREDELHSHHVDFPRLAMPPARKGFYTVEEYDTHHARLAARSATAADIFEFLWLTGWRFNEGRGLLWTEVDRAGQVIRLEAARNKTRTPRSVPITGELAALIARRFKARRLGCPYVFDGPDGGAYAQTTWREHYKAVDRETQAEGWAPKHPHQLRRAMVRDQRRAGVSDPVAMANTGHRNRSVFDQYDVTEHADQAAAQALLAEYRAARRAHAQKNAQATA